MKSLEKKLDKAFQKLARGQQCHYCFRPATCVHHIRRRADRLHRWNKANGLFLCHKHHFDIHNNGLEEPEVEFGDVGLKDYLLKNSLTYDDFLQAKREEFGI